MHYFSHWWQWWQPNQPVSIDPTKTYIDNTRARFLKLLVEREKFSSNIDSLVYNKKAFLQVLTDGDNFLEKSWKSRLFMESTPIGNIVMFYDIFKQGFSYYCDQPVVSYDILNSVAMKYVLRFFCVDFFLDENVLGEKGSPLKAIFIDDEPVEKKKPSGEVAIDLKDAPFAKLKNYAVSSKKTRNVITKTPVYFRTNYPWLWHLWFRIQYHIVLPVYQFGYWVVRVFIANSSKHDAIVSNKDDCNEKPEKEKIRNKFIYLGRFRNFKIIQPIVKKNALNGGSTKYDALFDSKKAVSYKDFKQGSL